MPGLTKKVQHLSDLFDIPGRALGVKKGKQDVTIGTQRCGRLEVVCLEVSSGLECGDHPLATDMSSEKVQ